MSRSSAVISRTPAIYLGPELHGTLAGWGETVVPNPAPWQKLGQVLDRAGVTGPSPALILSLPEERHKTAMPEDTLYAAANGAEVQRQDLQGETDGPVSSALEVGKLSAPRTDLGLSTNVVSAIFRPERDKLERRRIRHHAGGLVTSMGAAILGAAYQPEHPTSTLPALVAVLGLTYLLGTRQFTQRRHQQLSDAQTKAQDALQGTPLVQVVPSPKGTKR